MKISPRIRFILILLLAAISISFITIYFTNQFVKQLKEEERDKINLWANAVKYISDESDACQDFALIFEIVQNNKTVPVILTDENGSLIGYRNIYIGNPSDTSQINKILNKMKEVHSPIEINLPDGSKNYVYYFDSITLKKLNYYPYMQLFIIFIFIGVSFLAYSQARKSEQNLIWLGMAKETAHQLGTPTSSLMACSEILKEKYSNDEIIMELEKDVKRVETITNRFSKIGSKPKLGNININTVIEQTIEYQLKRCPNTIKINYRKSKIPILVKANDILIGWVLENLIKNAIDAMQGVGSIKITTNVQKKRVYIDISDEGKGIEKRNFKEVFRAGYSTKERGWGIGLSLAKRIVEEYHHGKIFVLSSELNKGTTFRIVLKKG
ncbi:sensor histidine kinase [Tenuifilum thalassicum]|uniref:histidine kinase n=1 Tax=Tenuifilum thalassicum TaxID=2590900 RepID=A0A7D3XXX3_9BACT|nr:HAMP domain-containing sensor histidine kinase [Tenuifilum thalassicum]QKG81171.1 HAMP domain-containing histidine kinase [Tenuifilum thalassicum]